MRVRGRTMSCPPSEIPGEAGLHRAPCFFKGEISAGTWLLNLGFCFFFFVGATKNLPRELYLFNEGRFSGVSDLLYRYCCSCTLVIHRLEM